MKSIFILVTFSTSLVGCQPKTENPLEISTLYCDCLTSKLQGAKDSSVDINVCNYIFQKSRFFNIKFDEDHSKYDRKTLDSANSFFIEVENILDTLCYNKIDYRKIKEDPHRF